MVGRVQMSGIVEGDFADLLDALSATSKGRAFLAEYLRRHRPKETRALLDALQRIEATVGLLRDQVQPDRIGSELRRIAGTLDIAAEDSRSADQNGEGVWRSALLARASADLTALAEGIASGAHTTPSTLANAGGSNSKPLSADTIRDDLMFLDQLADEAGDADAARY